MSDDETYDDYRNPFDPSDEEESEFYFDGSWLEDNAEEVCDEYGDPVGPSDEEQSEMYFNNSWLGYNDDEDNGNDGFPCEDSDDDHLGFDFNGSDLDSNLSDYVDDRQYDDEEYDIEEERKFAGLKNAVIDTTSNGFHLQSGDKNIDDRYRSTLTHDAKSKFGDFIVSYLFTSALDNDMASTSSYYISKQNLNPTTDSECTPMSKLFIGSIDARVTRKQLVDYFNGKDYPIKRLYFKKNPGRFSFAIVTFINDATAARVLFRSGRTSEFTLNGRSLNIQRHTPKQKVGSSTTTTLASSVSSSSTCTVKIADVHYGNVISAIALQSMCHSSSTTNDPNQIAIIGHLLTSSSSWHLTIDYGNKKVRFVASTDLPWTFERKVTNELIIEWDFQDLKGNKIRPVCVDVALDDQQMNQPVYLILEVKTPPIIKQKTFIPFSSDANDHQKRLPGSNLIGHANVWLFRLASDQLDRDYTELFQCLSRHNLTAKLFTPQLIKHLASSPEQARQNFDHVKLLSNNVWIERNQQKVDTFLRQRWPSYSFPTKFELMKLISKHIITVHDLIVDDQAEQLLRRCSLATLTACTDLITEMAPVWYPGICDAIEHEAMESGGLQNDEDSHYSQALRTRNSQRTIDIRAHTITGTTIHVTQVESPSEQILGETDGPSSSSNTQGIFSRFLLFALETLRKKHELYRDATHDFYLTKAEIRLADSDPSLIRKIYITPTTILYEGPYEEEKCAVTRHFEQLQDNFLRVVFRDEDYRRLQNFNDDMDHLYQRIKDILSNGLTICDRRYDFLAFSSSQLREHSCWMFTSSNGSVTADSIRSWMGDFRGVRPVAKYAARLGQSFSTSIGGIQIQRRDFREIPDIKSRDGELCFTDGIGIISPTFAQQLVERVKPSDVACNPCAFQIRCGGYKGMVCVDVTGQTEAKGVKVLFRPSMNKFAANNHSIDVVHTSARPPIAYLNRQIILLLSSLGISDTMFLSLQDQMLTASLALTEDPRKAYETLREHGESGANGCHAFLMKYLKAFGQYREPFSQRMLRAIQASLIKELRTKAKIRVSDSWSLFGVVDETRTLRYGQVFIQIDQGDESKNGSQIITGPVLVTRNPCFHPGDIRRLEAVDVVGLRSLKNVVVFPSEGVRPHAAEMSGGDLDGDTFWVCRNPALLFKSNEEPFDYHEQAAEDAETNEDEEKVEDKGDYTIDDVINFFAQYIEADNLGMIANRHLALADQMAGDVKDQKCLQLARMHSTAVDFAKSGISAPRLHKDLRVDEYPHYMEKHDKKSRISKTILGQLYDCVKDYNITLNIDVQREIADGTTFPFDSFIVNGYKAYESEAFATKSEYDRELRRLMRQYGITHEQEVISGYILKFNSRQYAKDGNIFQLKQDIAHAYRAIRAKYLQLFWREFYEMEEGEPSEEEEEEKISWPEIAKKLTWKNQLDRLAFHGRKDMCEERVRQKASAWFMVTYEPFRRYLRQRRPRTNGGEASPPRFTDLLSFCWLVYPVLVEIYEQNSSMPKPVGRKRKAKNERPQAKKKARSSD